MVLWLYTIGIKAFSVLVSLAAFRSEKAQHWMKGRKGWREKIAAAELQGCLWFHCASVGEFEQARPVIESFRLKNPHQKILLTFYSPSGYQVRKDYGQVDHVAYLPADTKANMHDWLDLIRPKMLVLTKYDFWFNLMAEAHQRSIPMVVISVHLPEAHWLFRWPGKLLLPRLDQFKTIYVQESGTKQRLASHGLNDVKVTGDTRVDRVMTNAAEAYNESELERFVSDSRVMVAGSVWPSDSDLLLKAQDQWTDWKWIVAVHEPSEAIRKAWKERFGDKFLHWKNRDQQLKVSDDVSVIYIDFVGLLSKIYRFGQVAYVGGGFGSGIHNTLEPAAYGMPVLIGPKHQRFLEAAQLIEAGVVYEVSDASTLTEVLQTFDDQALISVRKSAREYFDNAKGASDMITQDLCAFLN